MVPNVNQITSKLATLNDQQLQQYAQMNKDDVYILALAVSEKNRRAALRSSAQAQGGPQPPVTDQEVAEMAPFPDAYATAPAGISTLEAPAINELGMAGGGVIGFAGGGEASGFVQDIKAIPDTYEAWWQKNREEDLRKQAEEEAAAQRRAAREEASRKASFFNYMFGTPSNEREGLAALQNLNQPPVPDTGDETARLLGRYPAPTTPPTTPPATTPPADRAGGAPRPTPDKKAPPIATDGVGGGTTTPASVQAAEQPAPGGLEALLMQSNRGLEAGQKAYADALRQQGEDVKQAQLERLRSFEERQKAAEKADEPQRKRIEEAQEKQREKRENAWVPALIQGAAAALISRDRRPLARLAQGINAGMVQYTGNLEAIDKAEDRLRGELDTLDALKAKAAAASGEKRDELQALVRDAESKAKNSMGMWLAEQQIQVTTKTNEKLFEALLQKDRDARQNTQRMKELAYQRDTSRQVAQIGSTSRVDSSNNKLMQEYGDLQQKVYEKLLQTPAYQTASPEARANMLDAELKTMVAANPFLRDLLFEKKAEDGDKVLKSSAMPK